MARQLVFTSCERGLVPGTYGFTTVAATPDIPDRLRQRLELMSGYTPPAGAAAPGPEVWSCIQLQIDGRWCPVLTRNGPTSADHTGRANTLAWHVLPDPHERPDVGPAACLGGPPFADRWTGPARVLDAARLLPIIPAAPDAPTWRRLTGDAGWAGHVAAGLRGAGGPVVLVHAPEIPARDLLALIAEVVALLPPAERWEVTFSTASPAVARDQRCRLRCQPPSNPLPAGAVAIAIRTDAGPAPDSPAAAAARSGTTLPPLDRAPSPGLAVAEVTWATPTAQAPDSAARPWSLDDGSDAGHRRFDPVRGRASEAPSRGGPWVWMALAAVVVAIGAVVAWWSALPSPLHTDPVTVAKPDPKPIIEPTPVLVSEPTTPAGPPAQVTAPPVASSPAPQPQSEPVAVRSEPTPVQRWYGAFLADDKEVARLLGKVGKDSATVGRLALRLQDGDRWTVTTRTPASKPGGRTAAIAIQADAVVVDLPASTTFDDATASRLVIRLGSSGEIDVPAETASDSAWYVLIWRGVGATMPIVVARGPGPAVEERVVTLAPGSKAEAGLNRKADPWTFPRFPEPGQPASEKDVETVRTWVDPQEGLALLTYAFGFNEQLDAVQKIKKDDDRERKERALTAELDARIRSASRSWTVVQGWIDDLRDKDWKNIDTYKSMTPILAPGTQWKHLSLRGIIAYACGNKVPPNAQKTIVDQLTKKAENHRKLIRSAHARAKDNLDRWDTYESMRLRLLRELQAEASKIDPDAWGFPRRIIRYRAPDIPYPGPIGSM
ncbi:MAG: hypothetical protein RLZZ127_2793, partial [Planctomycetota bacterium]